MWMDKKIAPHNKSEGMTREGVDEYSDSCSGLKKHAQTAEILQPKILQVGKKWKEQ